MSITVTYYLTNTASVVLATANQILANVATSASLTNNNTNLQPNALGWVELWSQGNASAQAGASVKPGPSGHGWIDDSSALTANVWNSGNWVQTLPLETTATGSFIADIHIRVWKYNSSSSTYTFIAEAILPGQTVISTAYTNEVVSALNAAASGQFASGEHTYTDCLVNILTNGTTGNVRMRMASSSTAGNTSAQLATPGFNTAAYNAQQMTYDELQTQYARIRASSFVTNNYLSLLGFTYYVPAQILNEHTLPGELDALFDWESWDNLHTMRTVNDVTDFLGGTVNQLTIYNIADPAYGAIGDGVTDNTNAITAANQAASVNGSILYTPPGTFITGPQTLYPKVHYIGCGIGVSTWKLKAGSNGDLLSAQTSLINLSAAANSGSVGALLDFAVCGMTLDGNKANQSAASYCLRFYGYHFLLRDVEVTNAFSDGMLCDWNGGSFIGSGPEMESLIDNCKFHDNGGTGLRVGGPHDSRMRDVVSFSNSQHNFHFAPNSAGLLAANCHGYLNANVANTCCYLVESGCSFINCVAEGSFYCDVAMISNGCSWIGGVIFGTSAEWTNEVGIQLGQQAGQTPFASMIQQSGGVTTAVQATGITINTTIQECHGGALNCANEASNLIDVNVYQTAGTALVGDAINKTSDTFRLNVQGLTTDNSLGKSGGMNVCTNGGFFAFTLTDAVNGQIFQIDNIGNLYMPAAAGLNTAAALFFTTSTTAASLASSGTINLANLAVVAVAPTSNVSGVIMQAGFGGQFSVVINASAFSIQFAASGTSNVAAGASEIIQPNSAKTYFFDGTTNLWYGMTPGGMASATAATIASSGTITTAGVDQARVTTSGAVTGVILQAGTYANQPCVVVNESANSITFAAVGTSNVADGTSAVIAANRCMIFRWDAGTSKWYHA